MKIRILFFSVLQDIAGCEELELELPVDVGNMGQLLDLLYDRWPLLGDWRGKILTAADLQYVGSEHVLEDGQEIAIMPPVQGG
ncbi:MAG: MoaD/ThiS family protein [Verrucomicrobiales bacterium]|nr:MoaD/ThiS family protein [Verrucomicrobiales bacterium]MED5584820.1 MoaD/ThiS family protein [Verrucomicrobiota bacterium]